MWKSTDIFKPVKWKENNKEKTYVRTSFVNEANNVLVQLDNSFKIQEEYFLNFLCYPQWNEYIYNTLLNLICINNIFSFIF